jgi:hypothetical protein
MSTRGHVLNATWTPKVPADLPGAQTVMPAFITSLSRPASAQGKEPLILGAPSAYRLQDSFARRSGAPRRLSGGPSARTWRVTVGAHRAGQLDAVARVRWMQLGTFEMSGTVTSQAFGCSRPSMPANRSAAETPSVLASLETVRTPGSRSLRSILATCVMLRSAVCASRS